MKKQVQILVNHVIHQYIHSKSFEFSDIFWSSWFIMIIHHTLWWTNIAMENHHVEWENPLFLWPCSIAFCRFTRGYIIYINIPEVSASSKVKIPKSWRWPDGRACCIQVAMSSLSCIMKVTHRLRACIPRYPKMFGHFANETYGKCMSNVVKMLLKCG